MNKQTRSALAALASGTLFGLGLAISQMVDPEKVLAFLDLGAIATGGWDPSLLIVLVAAVGTNLLGYRLVLRRPSPLLSANFQLPTATAIDVKLVAGSALFGVGWGMAGYCPGPALAALTQGSMDAAVFTVAMLAGMLGFQRLEALGRTAPDH